MSRPASDEALDAFWERAKPHAQLNRVPIYLATSPLEVVRPNAWSFGATPEHADELLALVLDGTKTATASDLRWYDEQDPAPQVGEMAIVLDSTDRPRALIVTTGVEVVPFDQVSEQHAYAEGEGDRSLEHWRLAHKAYFTHHGPEGASFAPDMPVLCETFEVIYSEA